MSIQYLVLFCLRIEKNSKLFFKSTLVPVLSEAVMFNLTMHMALMLEGCSEQIDYCRYNELPDTDIITCSSTHVRNLF